LSCVDVPRLASSICGQIADLGVLCSNVRLGTRRFDGFQIAVSGSGDDASQRVES
jgi:hypothetical protein